MEALIGSLQSLRPPLADWQLFFFLTVCHISTGPFLFTPILCPSKTEKLRKSLNPFSLGICIPIKSRKISLYQKKRDPVGLHARPEGLQCSRHNLAASHWRVQACSDSAFSSPATASLKEQTITDDAPNLGRGNIFPLNCACLSGTPQTYFCSFLVKLSWIHWMLKDLSFFRVWDKTVWENEDKFWGVGGIWRHDTFPCRSKTS